jgi:ribosomal protein S14
MIEDDEPIRPMTLGSMRQHGVRGLHATCQHCGHERAVSMDDWPDDATVPSFGPRTRCSRCGKLGAMAVPNWIERAGTLPG